MQLKVFVQKLKDCAITREKPVGTAASSMTRVFASLVGRAMDCASLSHLAACNVTSSASKTRK